jgi:hypothetical protein
LYPNFPIGHTDWRSLSKRHQANILLTGQF